MGDSMTMKLVLIGSAHLAILDEQGNEVDQILLDTQKITDLLRDRLDDLLITRLRGKKST